MPDQTVLTGVSQEPIKRTYRRRTFKIFHLTRILQDVPVADGEFTCQETTYGQNVALVVIAETAQEARELATDNSFGDSSHVWLDRRKSSITEIGTASKDEQKSRVVLIDCNEG